MYLKPFQWPAHLLKLAICDLDRLPTESDVITRSVGALHVFVCTYFVRPLFNTYSLIYEMYLKPFQWPAHLLKLAICNLDRLPIESGVITRSVGALHVYVCTYFVRTLINTYSLIYEMYLKPFQWPAHLLKLAICNLDRLPTESGVITRRWALPFYIPTPIWRK